MAQNVEMCTIDPELKDKVKKFRFRKEKNNAMISCKIDYESRVVILDEEFENIDFEELQEELPAHQPRFLVISYVYNHDDGRVSYPLCFIFYTPQGSKPELQMMYAGTKLAVVKEFAMTKVFEIRSLEELTEEWLLEKLGFFH